MISTYVRNIKNILESDDIIDKEGFVVRDSLHPDFWTENGLKPFIRQRLISIVKDFFEGIGLPDLKIKDITFTGSLANYNWSKFSDIDLHVLVDFSEVNEDRDLVREMFNGKRFIWNERHNIPINGFEVEIYVQDDSESHESTGVYSVLSNEWLAQPQKVDPTIDWENIEKKVTWLMDQIDRVQCCYDEKSYADAHNHAVRIKEKIKRFRQSGLEREGAYSAENIAFKVLRRNGSLAKLSALKDRAYDKKMAIVKGSGINVKVGDLVKGWKEYLQEDVESAIKTFEVNIRVAINKKTGLTKNETAAEIRSIPGVTTVNVVPGSVTDALTSYYQTLSIRFCCLGGIPINPGLYIRKQLVGGMRSIKGLSVVRVVGSYDEL